MVIQYNQTEVRTRCNSSQTTDISEQLSCGFQVCWVYFDFVVNRLQASNRHSGSSIEQGNWTEWYDKFTNVELIGKTRQIQVNQHAGA